MSRRRFLVEPGSLAPGRELALDPGEARHAAKVLRLRAGEEVWLLDGEGLVGRAEIVSLDRRGVVCRVVEVQAPPLPRPRLVVCPGLAKNPAMELLAVKLSELMVQQVRPFVSSRSVPRLKDPAARARRWQRLGRQALKQCGAARAPRWHQPVDLADLLALPPAGARKIMLYEDESAGPSLAQALGGEAAEEVWVLVGPEGGFAPQEARAAREAGWLTCLLPGAVLRAETAALAAAAVVRFG